MSATTTSTRKIHAGRSYGPGFKSRHYTVAALMENIDYHLQSLPGKYDHDAVAVDWMREVGLFPISSVDVDVWMGVAARNRVA